MNKDLVDKLDTARGMAMNPELFKEIADHPFISGETYLGLPIIQNQWIPPDRIVILPKEIWESPTIIEIERGER